jgi:hypothetical protein
MAKRARQSSRAQRKIEEVRRQQRRRQMRTRAWIGAGAVAVVAVVAVVLVFTLGGGGTTAATKHAATGAPVDGIGCQTNEQVVYHIHSHLAIFDNGQQQVVPRGIGIPGPQQVQDGFVESGKCFYWLHTHDTTGVIHVESPTKRTYTLGQFFDIWGQPLSNSQVGTATGKLTVFVDGHQFSGDPRSIVLTPHKVIQLDVGAVVPPKSFTFPAGL